MIIAGGLLCGPLAHTSAAHDQTVAMHARKHVQKISGGPMQFIFGQPGVKN